MGGRKERRESKLHRRNKTEEEEETSVCCFFAAHESSSDPIMTEAALPLSPTANLRLHVFRTHQHAHTHTHTQVVAAIFARTFHTRVSSIRVKMPR